MYIVGSHNAMHKSVFVMFACYSILNVWCCVCACVVAGVGVQMYFECAPLFIAHVILLLVT